MASQTQMLPVSNIFANPASAIPSETAQLPFVLSIGRDAALLSTRADVLKMAGCRVQTATVQEAAELVAKQAFRIVVFCHSLSESETAELAVKVRFSNPQTSMVLLLSRGNRPPAFLESLFDVSVATGDGPAALVRSVRQVLARPACHTS